MSVAYQVLAIDNEFESVFQWFRKLPNHVRWTQRDDGYVIHLADVGPLAPSPEKIDQSQSPLVWFIKPRLVRGALWTIGEIIFTPTPLKKRFPDIHRISKEFHSWLQQFPLVYSWQKPRLCEYLYYLECGIQNRDVELYALPRAHVELKNGQYFIHHEAAEPAIDTLCRALRLRGVPIETGAQPCAGGNRYPA